MGKYSKAKMFNRKAARRKSKADEILNTLNIRLGQTIADIGSGGDSSRSSFHNKWGRTGKSMRLIRIKTSLNLLTNKQPDINLRT